MKTTSLIQFTVLAAVVLASANVSASDACYGQPLRGGGSSRGSAIEIILCLINLVTTGNVTPSEVLKCMARNQMHMMPPGEQNFAHFSVRNGESVSETGTIMNAELTWGKWQVHGTDVDTVNNMEFDSSKPATFTAIGRSFAASGTEGFFEIHESGKNIAVVQFDVPFVGANKLHIKQVDKSYLCDDKGFSGSGSPTIEITCHKIASSRMYN